MVSKCANNWCLTPRQGHEGKLFRLDIDLGNMSGGNERKTEYIWLCACCVLKMHPYVVVTGNTVTVRLSKNETLGVEGINRSSAHVN
jgi:hypothetical protein